MSSGASANCAGCLEAITDWRFLKCYLCKQSYDLLCANMSEAHFNGSMTVQLRNSWKCQVCRCKEPKTDNTHTPVRMGRADFDDSIVQLEDKSSGELPLTTHEHDESVEIVCPNKSMSDNVTIRRKGKFQGNDTLSEDLLYLENLRPIIQEEVALSVTERMVSIISDAVSEKIMCPLHSAINGLIDRVIILEGMVSKLESRSQSSCGDPHCPSRMTDPSGPFMESNREQPLVQNYHKQRPSGKPVKQPLTLMQHNTTAAKLPMQPQGSTSKAAPIEKGDEPVLNRKMGTAASSDATSSMKNMIKDNSGNPTGTIKSRDASDESSGWTEVRRKRSIRSALSHATRGSAAAGSTQLEASEWLRRIHLFYVKEGTTENQIKSHLKSITGSEGIEVKTLKPRGPYASFKLSVPSNLFDQVMAPESWPLNVCVKPWTQPFRRREENQA